MSESDILDVRKPLKELNISFEGEDIQKDNLNLRLIRFSLKNSGQVDVLQGFYDENGLWGFEISNGKIIEIRQVESNSNYLKENIKPVIASNNLVQFEKVILEKEKYITFELLVLHNKSEPPVILPVGKIAGVDKFLLTHNISEEEETSSFWNVILHGKIHIHLIRAIIYLLTFIMISAIIIFIITKVSGIKEAHGIKKRRKIVEKISLKSNNKHLGEICNLYIDGKFYILLNLYKLLDNHDETIKRIEIIKIKTKYRSDLNKLGYSVLHDNFRYYDHFTEERMMSREANNKRKIVFHTSEEDKILFQLFNDDLIKVEGQTLTLDSPLKNTLDIIVGLIS